jgi:hypothetical protein
MSIFSGITLDGFFTLLRVNVLPLLAGMAIGGVLVWLF